MRILIAGTNSGCGKTTASLLVMAALAQRGLSVAPYKVGPDYIDPSFHRVVCGRASHNLDTFLMSENTLFTLLDHSEDIAVIEGVMGYYDGSDMKTLRSSSWEMARITKTPVLLVVDASGGAASVAAQVKGFMNLVEDCGIRGVLVNRVSSQRHYQLVAEAVLYYTGLPCVGYLTKNTKLAFPSRHLGLIPADELPDAAAMIASAATQAQQTLDLSMIIQLAKSAPALPYHHHQVESVAPYRLGVARDEAFSFYYEANMQYLRQMGMELVAFSPLNDACLPQGLNGLYFGGGFPEVFAERLHLNRSMRASIFEALDGGMPCYGECGGLMYLSQEIDGREMVGFLPAKCHMTERLQRFGYVNVRERTGLTFPAHEFHHSVATPVGDVQYAYDVRKASQPERTWSCGFEKKRTLAAFAHVHFYDHPEIVRRLWL